MKLLILSDLHIEWGPFTAPPCKTFDAVVLAGDIAQGPKAVRWAAREFTFGSKPVVLVPGNDDFYDLERECTLERMREDARGTNVHVLDRDELVLRGPADGHVRFLGATLCTDFGMDGADIASAMSRARVSLNDFAGSIHHRHSEGQRRFTPEDSVREHDASRTWLAEHIAQPCPEGGSTIVVTHHGPSRRSIVPEYEGDDLNPCFVSDFPGSFFAQPLLCVHGHIHSSVDYRTGRTRVVANPRGYRQRSGAFENADFRRDLVIEVQT